MTATFRRTPFGYSRAEVDEYISQLRAEIDALRESTQTLSAQVQEQKQQIDKYRDQERYISGALLDAQNRAVQIEQRAQENYDRCIMRLAEDSKVWEDRIQKNKERLLALDEMLVSFLSGVKAEMGAARSDATGDWKSVLEEADRAALTQAQDQMPDKTEAAPAAVSQPQADEPVPQDDAVAPQDRGEPAQEPQVDSDIHSLYWRLKHLQQGDQPHKPTVNPRKKEDEALQADMHADMQEEKKQTAAAQSKEGMYMPAQNEQERLTSILNELGILPEQ